MGRNSRAHSDPQSQELTEMDAFVLAIAFGFFALTFGYIKVCERI